MRHPVRALQTLLVVPIFALAACGGNGAANTHPGAPGVSTSGTPASTATTPGAGGSSTTSCIPQGGGDHDADNSGAPSDGDGCL